MLRELGIAVFVYLVLYYVANLLIVQKVASTPYCPNVAELVKSNTQNDPTIDKKTKNGFSNTLKSLFFEANDTTIWIENWNKAENGIAFTFFLGAYVTALLARWWQQVSAIPKLDNLISALHSDSGISQEKRKNVDIAERDKIFKNKIVRYCLLSIFLRLADLSSKVRRAFPTKDDYIEKGLLTKDEYDEFAQKGMFDKTTIDGMSCKWFIPLNWAVFSARDVGMDSSNPSLKEHKLTVKEIAGIHKKLLELTNFKKYQVPRLMNQAVTLVIFVYFACGLIASQGKQSCEDLRANNENAFGGIVGSTMMALAMNFPFFQIMKYLLILTWFRVGKYLQRPFGHDR